MTKTNKTFIIMSIITIMTMLFCGVVLTAHAEDSDTFELCGVVTAWQDVQDCREYSVTLEDGTVLAFYADAGDFRIGDMVWLLVWDETQMEVLDVWYVTNLEWDEMARWLARTSL